MPKLLFARQSPGNVEPSDLWFSILQLLDVVLASADCFQAAPAVGVKAGPQARPHGPGLVRGEDAATLEPREPAHAATQSSPRRTSLAAPIRRFGYKDRADHQDELRNYGSSRGPTPPGHGARSDIGTATQYEWRAGSGVATVLADLAL